MKALEWSKDSIRVPGVEADAVVLDRDSAHRSIVRVSGIWQQPRFDYDVWRNVLRAEFERIEQQVVDYLSKLVLVGLEMHIRIYIDPRAHVPDVHLQVRHRLLNDVGHMHPGSRPPLRGHAREVQHVREQVRHPLRRVPDAAQVEPGLV